MIVNCINNLIDFILISYGKYVLKSVAGYRFIDPNDHKEITAHYGTTHFAAALILIGKQRGDPTLIEDGIGLVSSYCSKWDEYALSPEFHADFNLFALSVITDVLEHDKNSSKLVDHLKCLILRSKDSVHNTINWLPMRFYVNKKRYSWSGDERYKTTCNNLISRIIKAVNRDGTVEDHLPYGVSYNLQYNVSTVALLQFLRACGLVDYDLSVTVSALLKLVAPDGDINYFGRGTNQIFAWGPWFFLLKSLGMNTDIEKGLAYFSKKLPSAISNYNLLLNDDIGSSKYLWWDYHYASVYTAHLLFWLALSLEERYRCSGATVHNLNKLDGIDINANDNWACTIFHGRKRYLSEKGPTLAMAWSAKYGMIFKGGFGPWGGAFGNKWNYGNSIYFNYFGVYNVKNKPGRRFSRLKKMLPLPLSETYSHSVSPQFCPIKSLIHADKMELSFEIQDKQISFINIPIFEECGISRENILLTADEKPVEFYQSAKIKNQYGWCNIFQSRVIKTSNWKICFSEQDKA